MMIKSIVIALVALTATGCATKDYVSMPREDFDKIAQAYRAQIEELQRRELLLRIEHNKEIMQAPVKGMRNAECKFFCF